MRYCLRIGVALALGASVGAPPVAAVTARTLSLAAPCTRAPPALQPPQVLFGDLFAAVERSGAFADGKTFADALPRESPEMILTAYSGSRPDSRRALERFVAQHFTLPPNPVTRVAAPNDVPLAAHIDALWGVLTRHTPTAPRWSSLLPLPEAYVVPGGRFRELYYWDSYFTMLGLAASGRHDLVDSMVRDFAYLIDEYGHVPNGTRTYYLSRSQPPFFFAMVALLASEEEGAARYLPELRCEYAFWMEGADRLRPGAAHRRVIALPDGALLNRYWDDRDTPRDEAYALDSALARGSGRPPRQVFRDIRAAAESGWDFSSRWFADGHHRQSIETTAIIPVDLNSLLLALENAIQRGCERAADRGCARQFAHRAARRRAAIDHYLWDKAGAAYLDYCWTRRSRVARLSAATLYPLFVGAASAHQAAAVADTVRTQLLKEGGLVTTTLVSGEQWDAPNGWAPLQWIGVSGLERYGQGQLAATIACRWLLSVSRGYRTSAKLVEKYDVVDVGRSGGGGEYPTQDGFGWTNGVTRVLAARYPAAATAVECGAAADSVPEHAAP
jgi:alpha,alpha-trehalase